MAIKGKVTVAEAAEILGIGKHGVRYHIRARNLSVEKVGERLYLLDKAEVETFDPKQGLRAKPAEK